MTIERVGVPDPVSKYNKTEKNQKPKAKGKSDSINVSQDAKFKAEVYATTEAAKVSPDIRMDRVEEVRKKLEDPSYLSDELIEDLAEKIMRYFNI
jgi:negative regulator of flagellin synthesis FlgM